MSHEKIQPSLLIQLCLFYIPLAYIKYRLGYAKNVCPV